jgi:hypothetical protein
LNGARGEFARCAPAAAVKRWVNKAAVAEWDAGRAVAPQELFLYLGLEFVKLVFGHGQKVMPQACHRSSERTIAAR